MIINDSFTWQRVQRSFEDPQVAFLRLQRDGVDNSDAGYDEQVQNAHGILAAVTFAVSFAKSLVQFS